MLKTPAVAASDVVFEIEALPTTPLGQRLDKPESS